MKNEMETKINNENENPKNQNNPLSTSTIKLYFPKFIIEFDGVFPVVDFRVPEPSDAHRRTLRLLVEAASLKPRLVKKGGDIFDRVEQVSFSSDHPHPMFGRRRVALQNCGDSNISTPSVPINKHSSLISKTVYLMFRLLESGT